MTTHLLPVLPPGWAWQQHSASVAFVVARNGHERSKPINVDDTRALRQFAERFGRVRMRRTRIVEQGYSAEECAAYTQETANVNNYDLL